MARATGNSRDGAEPSTRPSTAYRVDAEVEQLAGQLQKRTRKTSLSVIIINYCQWSNTSRLVRQLRNSEATRSRSAEIVIVDNHSPAHRLSAVLSRHRDVQVKLSRRNEGFARAVNRGVALSQGEWVLLLNPDVTLADSVLDEILATATREAEDVGVVGFQLLNPDGSRQASCGPFPTLGKSLLGLLRPRSTRKCQHRSSEHRQQVPWATGGCLLIRRKCFEQLNGLDEAFFLYYEDVDFCRRASELGWKVCFEPGISVTHHWPLHRRTVPAPLRLITRHALLTYSRKHWTKRQQFWLSGLISLEARLREYAARMHGDYDAATIYHALRQLAQAQTRSDWNDAQRVIHSAASAMRPVSLAHDSPR